MPDLPIELDADLAERLAAALDVEAKIPRALDALGPIAGRDVGLVDGADGIRARQLTDLGGRVTYVRSDAAGRFDTPDASVDVLLAMWSPFRGAETGEAAEVERVLRPGGRQLLMLDYGRDDVSRLRGDQPEYGILSRRNGPLLGCGFKVRVVHCFWTFASIEAARAMLDELFGEVGRIVAGEMTRPRLSYNVAVYHRTVGAPA